MSEVYLIVLSAAFSSFIITIGIITVLYVLYTLTYKCFASYISFDKIAQAQKKSSSINDLTVSN